MLCCGPGPPSSLCDDVDVDAELHIIVQLGSDAVFANGLDVVGNRQLLTIEFNTRLSQNGRHDVGRSDRAEQTTFSSGSLGLDLDDLGNQG